MGLGSKVKSRFLWLRVWAPSLVAVIIANYSSFLVRANSGSGWSSKIVDGKNVTPINKYPMILRIGNRVKESLCGATILNKRWGLTAAHCMKEPAEQLYVLAGLYYDGKPDPMYTQNVSITNISLHVGYGKPAPGVNDIALFRVSPAFVFNERVAPVNLAPFEWHVLQDKQENANVVGWGLGRNRTRPYPPDYPLQEVDIPLRTTGVCQRVYFFRTITDHHVCAGGVDGAGSCNGDSGGPLFVYDKDFDIHYQVGITAFGAGYGVCGNETIQFWPKVWTKVTKYIGWIEETTRECGPPREFPIGSEEYL